MTEQKILESNEDRTAHIVFPDEQACVRILEILHPFSTEQRDLILAVVAANPRYPRAISRGASSAWPFRSVTMPEPLPSLKERSV